MDAVSTTQDTLAKWAEGWRGTATDGRRPASEYHWAVTSLAPEAFDEMTHAEWVKWFDAEMQMWVQDGEPDRYADMVQPIREEVFASYEVIDGRRTLLIWDGYHRVGAAHKHGHASLPAIIGTPR